VLLDRALRLPLRSHEDHVLAGGDGLLEEPLGEEETKAAKELAGWPLEPTFYVPAEVRDLFAKRAAELLPDYEAWQAMFAKYRREFPE